MKSNNGPWYRKSRDAWYVQFEGKQVMLAKGKSNRSAARQAWLSLMNGDKSAAGATRLSSCFDDYLTQFTGESLRVRQRICGAFLAHVGKARLACDVKHKDFERYVKPAWSDSTTLSHLKTISAALNRAVKKKLLAANPLAGIEKPSWKRRGSVLSAEELRRMVEWSVAPFKPLLLAMIATGCRPGEIRKLRVEDCDLEAGTWAVRNKTAKQTGLARRSIYLSDEVVAICRELIGTRKEGFVFLNSRGKPWSSLAVIRKFRRAREVLGLSDGATPYGVRHRYATDAINKHGMDSLVVAKLMGHTNPMMLAKVYYREDAAAMRAAANRASGTQHIPPALAAQPGGKSGAGAHEAQPES